MKDSKIDFRHLIASITITLLLVYSIVNIPYSYIYKYRKMFVIIISVVAVIAIIYNSKRVFKIIKTSENTQKKYMAKLSLINMIKGSLIMIISILLIYVFYI